MSNALNNLKNDIQKGRHLAFLGQYEESLKTFKSSNEEIEKIIKTCVDPLLRDDWKKLQNEINAEVSIVSELHNMIRGILKNPDIKAKKESNEIMKGVNECPEFSHENQYENKEKNPFPFGQRPFAFHEIQRNNEIYNQNNMNSPFINQNNQNSNNNNINNQPPDYGYNDDFEPNYNKNYNKREAPAKDPDVWEPAPPIKKKVTATNKPSKGRINPAQINQQNMKNNKMQPNIPSIQAQSKDKDKDKGRNYEKPWKVPEKKENGQGGGGENNEKSFLYHCYPDGIGPDSELIQMMEKDVLDINPNIKFEDIAELDKAKEILQEAVLLPIMIPSFFKGIRRPWKGVLMFGPPGTGKTMLAKAVATQGKTTFFNVSASSLASKWKGESEKMVRILFEMARFYSPSTIFFDEVDALCSKRAEGDHESSRKVKSELLIQMDGISSLTSDSNDSSDRKIVMVLAATNHPWELDEAMRRRLEKRIYIPLPTATGRLELFKINLTDINLAKDIDWDVLVKKSDGYSGADISNVCREAAYMPMRKKLIQDGGFNKLNKDALNQLQTELDVPLTQKDFEEALRNVSKSVSNVDLSKYESWMAEFGSI